MIEVKSSNKVAFLGKSGGRDSTESAKSSNQAVGVAGHVPLNDEKQQMMKEFWDSLLWDDKDAANLVWEFLGCTVRTLPFQANPKKTSYPTSFKQGPGEIVMYNPKRTLSALSQVSKVEWNKHVTKKFPYDFPIDLFNRRKFLECWKNGKPVEGPPYCHPSVSMPIITSPADPYYYVNAEVPEDGKWVISADQHVHSDDVGLRTPYKRAVDIADYKSSGFNGIMQRPSNMMQRPSSMMQRPDENEQPLEPVEFQSNALLDDKLCTRYDEINGRLRDVISSFTKLHDLITAWKWYVQSENRNEPVEEKVLIIKRIAQLITNAYAINAHAGNNAYAGSTGDSQGEKGDVGGLNAKILSDSIDPLPNFAMLSDPSHDPLPELNDPFLALKMMELTEWIKRMVPIVSRESKIYSDMMTFRSDQTGFQLMWFPMLIQMMERRYKEMISALKIVPNWSVNNADTPTPVARPVAGDVTLNQQHDVTFHQYTEFEIIRERQTVFEILKEITLFAWSSLTGNNLSVPTSVVMSRIYTLSNGRDQRARQLVRGVSDSDVDRSRGPSFRSDVADPSSGTTTSSSILKHDSPSKAARKFYFSIYELALGKLKAFKLRGEWRSLQLRGLENHIFDVDLPLEIILETG